MPPAKLTITLGLQLPRPLLTMVPLLSEAAIPIQRQWPLPLLLTPKFKAAVKVREDVQE